MKTDRRIRLERLSMRVQQARIAEHSAYSPRAKHLAHLHAIGASIACLALVNSCDPESLTAAADAVAAVLDSVAASIEASDWKVAQGSMSALADALLTFSRAAGVPYMDSPGKLCDALETAIGSQDSEAATVAIEAIREALGGGEGASPPKTRSPAIGAAASRWGFGQTISVRGQPVRLSVTEIAACKDAGAKVEDYAANKLIRARASGATINLAGQIEERKVART